MDMKRRRRLLIGGGSKRLFVYDPTKSTNLLVGSYTKAGGSYTTLTWSTSYIRLKGNDDGKSGSLTISGVDFTDYNILHIEVKGPRSTYGTGTVTCGDYSETITSASSLSSSEIIEWDISSMTGNERIVFRLNTIKASQSPSIYIYSIWLE